MNGLFFLMGLIGATGLVFSWPVQLLWVLFLLFGWGILVISD